MLCRGLSDGRKMFDVTQIERSFDLGEKKNQIHTFIAKKCLTERILALNSSTYA